MLDVGFPGDKVIDWLSPLREQWLGRQRSLGIEDRGQFGVLESFSRDCHRNHVELFGRLRGIVEYAVNSKPLKSLRMLFFVFLDFLSTN
jgi:hypothetical protein